MGKKGKKAAMQQQAAAADGGGGGGGGGRTKKKVGPGKAPERAATIRHLEDRIEALAKNLEIELEGVDVFSPLEERDGCPICLTTLPSCNDDLIYLSCCRNFICGACGDRQGIHKMLALTLDDVTAWTLPL